MKKMTKNKITLEDLASTVEGLATTVGGLATTVDKLSLSMKAGFSDANKKNNNTQNLVDKLAIMVARGFENMATKDDIKNQGDVSKIILKELQAIHEDNKYFRQSISTLNINDFSCDKKIENLTIRIEKLEFKAK